MQVLHSLAGITALLALAWVLSEDRRGVRWKIVATGMALTLALAALLLAIPWLKAAVFSLNAALEALERSTQTGRQTYDEVLVYAASCYREIIRFASTRHKDEQSIDIIHLL